MKQNAQDPSAWIGNKEVRSDILSEFPIRALAATLNENELASQPGAPVPPAWHWLYFLESRSASELGADGHPQRGGFLPPVALPRRMWAGGRLEFFRPLVIGEAAIRESEIVSVEAKSGRTGALVFVTVRHTIKAAGQVAIVEEQDIVYRDAAKKTDLLPVGKKAATEASWTRRLTPDAVLLFRYSALTFNAHRIHYDKDYAINEEHYQGLVVHGPLQATLLLQLCRQASSRTLRKFEYRVQYPVFCGQPFTLYGLERDGAQMELWTADHSGTYAMRATATF